MPHLPCSFSRLSKKKNHTGSLRLYPGRRYGLIGRNGIGKTTLLAAMANYEIKDFPTWIRVMHVEQEVTGDDQPVMAAVLSADAERELLLAEEVQLHAQIDGQEVEFPHKNPEERLGQVQQRLDEIDAHSAEARASAVLSGLGFTPHMLTMPTRSLLFVIFCLSNVSSLVMNGRLSASSN
jgi:ATP-binding cassette subfamily F protein 3